MRLGFVAKDRPELQHRSGRVTSKPKESGEPALKRCVDSCWSLGVADGYEATATQIGLVVNGQVWSSSTPQNVVALFSGGVHDRTPLRKR